jgi:hypothetical protein
MIPQRSDFEPDLICKKAKDKAGAEQAELLWASRKCVPDYSFRGTFASLGHHQE